MHPVSELNAMEPLPCLCSIVDAACRHSARGVTPFLFVAMLKTFRDACLSHITAEHASALIQWFDAAEVACFLDHEQCSADRRIQELSATALEMSLKRERIEMALATVAPPLVLCDAHGEVMACSDSATELLGRLGGTPADDSGKQQLPGFLMDMVQTFLARDSSEAIEDVSIEIDNEMRIYAVQLRKIKGVAQTTHGCVLLLLDVTEARQAEERLRSQDAAMAASQRLASIGWLAAGVAHEINNPLSTVMSYSEMLMDHVSFDKLPWLEEVLSEAGRIAEIVRRLQEMAQPGGEVVELSPSELVESVSQLTAAHLRKRHTYLKTNVPKNLQPVRCDIKALQQALISSILYLCALQRQVLPPDSNASIWMTVAQLPAETQIALFAESAALPEPNMNSNGLRAALSGCDLDQPFISLEWARHIALGQGCSLDDRCDETGVTLTLTIPSGA